MAQTAEGADRIDLGRPAAILWANRAAILIAAVVCAVLGYAAGYLLIKSRADSFLQLSYTSPITAADEKADKEGKDLRFRTNVAEYKVLSATVLARDGFLEYAAQRKALDPALIATLDTDLAKDNLLARWIHPVFAIARADLREIPDQPRDEANYLVGMEFQVERRSPQDALAIVTVLGDYVRDVALLLRAREFATGLFYKARSRLFDLERHMITQRLALKQAEEKQKELAGIRTRYPDAAHSDVRQVISVDKTTSRFLPPVAQLVGAESQIVEIRETLRLAEWDVDRAKAMIAFLEPAQAIVNETRSGTDLFPRLDKLMDATFDDKRLAADPWRDAYSTLKIEITGLKTLYFERMRFIAAPALNLTPLWVRLLPAGVGFLLGAVLAALVMVARARVPRSAAAAARDANA